MYTNLGDPVSKPERLSRTGRCEGRDDFILQKYETLFQGSFRQVVSR
jgi:hypothetical protein